MRIPRVIIKSFVVNRLRPRLNDWVHWPLAAFHYLLVWSELIRLPLGIVEHEVILDLFRDSYY